ncbi:MetQ/NlpA family ABC transporter substrate-binding protein [Anaerolentibacter hominis]|uniref:MetQ/NlpA family ABC transporter substrate-binding protein n=1 Tax=Anaerolentibacter hominis TaxID=3079009 RepID=UPI0031B8A3EA
MNSKQIMAMVLAGCIILLAGCSGPQNANDNIIRVGANASPHAEILRQAQGMMAQRGYTLEIIEYSDYIQPNLALDSRELDANYFQHEPYLERFNEERGTDLTAIAAIHYELFGVYGGKTKSLDELKTGAVIAVPNDTTNEARALMLLEELGLIRLKEGSGMLATTQDIEENMGQYEILELEAAQIPRSLRDVDLAVMNGNYALAAGLSIRKDALAKEDELRGAVETYANILAAKAGEEANPGIQALAEILKSEEIQTFIEENYGGNVLPVY